MQGRPRRGAGFLLLVIASLSVRAVAAVDAPDTTGAAAAAADGSLETREYHLVPGGAEALTLAHGYVDATSVEVSVDGRPWLRERDFKVRARSGVVVPLREWRDPGPAATDEPVVILVVYRFLPVAVTPRRDLRPVVAAPRRDGDAAAPRTEAPPAPIEASGENLRVSGSKTVQVASGSRREMTVDQNLRLQVVGQLTRDISVRAFLSDDNLPVVPEGNTEELRDIDKVLVELQAPTWSATLGDFVAERRDTEYGAYRRKLQGVSFLATPSPARAGVLAGSPRGRYRTLQIRGQEANQGPYYLGTGSAGENLFVVAGSERVTLDGEILTRGAERDYVIDYVRGTVTFTFRRLITTESTIVVEFEEGEGPYGRTVVGGGGGAGGRLGGVAGDFGVRIIREKDDPSRLRTGDLGEDDEAILRAAGDDPLQAVAPGAAQVEPGEGLYDQRVEDGKTIYAYNPAGGDWQLTLFYVGPGLGDYDLERLTETGQRIYVHRGDGLGSYRIGRPLPLPDSRSVLTTTAALGDTAGAHVGAEWHVSQDDRNLLSDLDDDDNRGEAVAVRGAVPRGDLVLGDRRFGHADLAAFYSARQASFRGFQLQKTVFDYDDWGLAERARREGFLEEGDREAGLAAGWGVGGQARSLELRGRVGSLRHGTSVAAEQIRGEAAWALLGGQGSHLAQRARAQDDQDPLDTERRRQRHAVSWKLGPVRPSARWLDETWQDARTAPGRAAGYRLEQWAWGLAGAGGGALTWNAEFVRGLADSLRTEGWQRERDSRTATASATTGRFLGMRLVGEATLRRTKRPAGEDETTRLARIDLAGVWEKTASDWALGYRVDNSRTEVLDRQIVFVGEGQGDYNADGDYLGRGQGDHDMVLAGTDSLVATTAVRADLQWRQGFRFLGADRWYGAWSLTSTGAVEGRSTTDDVGGLLALDRDVLFAPESAVLADVVLAEELALLQHLRAVDLRGKFDYRETRDRQFADHPEDRLSRDWQATGSVNVTPRSTIRLRWGREEERRYSSESDASARRSYVTLTQRYEAGWTFRPYADLRLELGGELLDRNDRVSGVSQRETAVRPALRRRFLRTWTAQAEVRYADVRSEEPTGALRPWFFPRPGPNAESSLRLAWEPSEFLTVSATWFARKQGEGGWQHDVRVETTARF